MEKKICVAIVLVAASCIARADNFYSSAASWDAAVSGITTVNFEGIIGPTPGYQAYGGTPPTTTVGGLIFDGPSSPTGSYLFLIADNFYGFGVATISAQADPPVTDDLKITLPSSVTAVGFDYFLDPGSYTVTLSDGTGSTIMPSATPTAGFFGVTDPAGFTSLDITIPTTLATLSINVGSVSYGTANPISPAPEPGSWILLGSLLGAFGLTVQRRRKQVTTIR